MWGLKAVISFPETARIKVTGMELDVAVFDPKRELDKAREDICKDWIKSGDISYRLEELAQTTGPFFPFEIDPLVDSYSMSAVSGAIAVYCRIKSLMKQTREIVMFDLAARPLTRSLHIPWDCYDVFHAVVSADKVVGVCDNGKGIVFEATEAPREFVVCRTGIVIGAAFCDDGCACLISDGTLVWVSKYAKTRGDIIHVFSAIEKPVQMEVVHKQDLTRVIIIRESGSVVTVTKDGAFEVRFKGNIIGCALSASRSLIALVSDEFIVTVTDTSMTVVMYNSILPEERLSNFQGMAWIGDEVPIVAFDGAVAPAGPGEVNGIWQVEGKPVVFTGHDFAVIVTSSKSFRFSVVPETVADIFGWSEGATLVKCFAERLVEPMIEKMALTGEKAIDDCLEAAQFMIGAENQRLFLNAAIFGNVYHNSLYHKKIEDVMYILWIVNSLRHKCNIWMTPKQLRIVNLDDLIEVLCCYHHHIIAVEIARGYGRRVNDIGKSYARYILDTIDDDNACWNEFMSHDFVDFAEAALCAFAKHRYDLENKLIEHNSIYSDSAKIYAAHSKWKKAFEKAELALDRSAQWTILQQALQFRESERFIGTSPPFVYNALEWPTFVDNDRMSEIIRKAGNAEIEHVRKRFMIRRGHPAMVIPSLTCMNSYTKAQKAISTETDERFGRCRPMNRALMDYSLRDDEACINTIVTASKLDVRRCYAVRLREHARAKGWNKFMQIAVMKECKSLRDLALQLSYAHGGRSQAQELANRFAIIYKSWSPAIDDYDPSNFSEACSHFKLLR